MIISKLDAAYRQLNTAIFLFFQDKDPVSVHTLVGAALEVLNNHIKDISVIYSNSLFTHYDTIYAKEDKRKEFHRILMKYRNFFSTLRMTLIQKLTSILI